MRWFAAIKAEKEQAVRALNVLYCRHCNLVWKRALTPFPLVVRFAHTSCPYSLGIFLVLPSALRKKFIDLFSIHYNLQSYRFFFYSNTNAIGAKASFAKTTVSLHPLNFSDLGYGNCARQVLKREFLNFCPRLRGYLCELLKKSLTVADVHLALSKFS